MGYPMMSGGLGLGELFMALPKPPISVVADHCLKYGNLGICARLHFGQGN